MTLPTAPFSDLALLVPEARARVAELARLVDAEGLGLYVYETFRLPTRQAELAAAGGSQLSSSAAPHPRRHAADFILRDKPPHNGRWWTGTVDARRTVVDAPLLRRWHRFGELAEGLGLEWGGRWGRSKNPDQLIGWDPYHVELPGWQKAPYVPPEAFKPEDPGSGGGLLALALLLPEIL